ncbi:MAG: hypothetical protein QOK05_168 [Chloroflexota bacterium]|nr:hypothetical protein [Chloroflexota bacterium]
MKLPVLARRESAPRFRFVGPRLAAACMAIALGGGSAALAAVPAAAAPPLSCVVNSTADGGWASGDNCETSTGGQVTLRSAIEALNAAGSGTHNITFNLPNPSVINTASLLSVSTGPLVITGPGARALAVDGAGTHADFETLDGVNLTITGMTIRNGSQEGDGGGIEARGPLTLDHVAVTGNTASGSGGGIDVQAGTMTITNSLVANNQGSNAAGIDLQGDGGSSSMTNVTVANNIDSGGNEAAGIELTGTTLNLNFVTIAANTYTGTPDAAGLGAAGIGAHDGGIVNFHNSLISGNEGKNCRFDVPAADTNDAAGSSTDQGYNLDSADDCGFTEGSPKFDAVKAAANLGTLGNNGGQTDTLGLGAGSRAIDTADPTCGAATDQRGTTRPQGARCDMGAFEVLATVASPSPSPTPALPKAGNEGRGAPGFIAVSLVAFAVLSLLVAARGAVTRRRSRP